MPLRSRVLTAGAVMGLAFLVACRGDILPTSTRHTASVEAIYEKTGGGFDFLQAAGGQYPQTVQVGALLRPDRVPTAPRFDQGGPMWGIIWIDSKKYAVVYGPHDGKLGPSIGYGRHMNFDVWATNKAFRTRDGGAAVRELANFHTAWANHNGKKCLYVYDNVSGGEKWFCPSHPPKSASEKFTYARQAVQYFFAAVLGITLAGWLAEIFAGVLALLIV